MGKQIKYIFWLISLFGLIIQQVHGFEFLDYTEQHVFKCNTPSSQTHDQMVASLILHEIDRYLYIIICPLTIFATSFIIYTFYQYPGTRNSPGDLLLGMSACELVLNLHWLISSIYAFANDGQSPPPTGFFCRMNSIFSIPAGILDFAYNFFLNLYISLTLKNSLKGFSPKTYYWHILMIISATIIIIIFETVPNWAGISVFGTCSYTSNRAMYISGPLIGITYALFGVYMFKQFHKVIPESNNRFKQKREQFMIYYAYVKVTSLLYLLTGLANLMIGINCAFFFNPGLNIFLTLTNFLKLLSPVILSMLRYRDPILKSRIRLIAKNCLKRFRKENRSSKTYNNSSNNQVDDVKINSDIKQNDISKSFIAGDDQFKNWKQFLRVVHLRSMVHGVRQEFQEEMPSICEFNNDDFKETKEIILDYESEEHIDERFEKLSMRMTVYAPNVFYSMRYKDNNILDFCKSLDEDLNDPKILKSTGEGQGGAGGEFFFATHDNNLLLKTINNTELNILLKKLDKFATHYEEKPESLITKIYGIFTFQQLASYDRPSHVVVMRNLLGIDSRYVVRKYDLKGSSYQRYESIKYRDKQLNEIVLKDIDFKEFESSIKANHQKKSDISQILEFDSNYLSGQGFMDYSLLVVKVDWNQYFLDQQSVNSSKQNLFNEEIQKSQISAQIANCIPNLYEKVKARFGNSDQYFFQSTEDPTIFYHIGVIDYLQQWTIKKSLERTWKNCINGKDVDTSSQPPRIYADRFKLYIRKIFANG